MYNPIQINYIPSKKIQYDQNCFLKQFLLTEASIEEIDLIHEIYTEAVFVNGKQTMQPIVSQMQKIKDLLEKQINLHDKSIDSDKKEGKFDPKAYWKNIEFKTLEDIIRDVFGFRHVSVEPFIENYISKDKIFSTKIMNCLVFLENRFPINGIVTDKGFYDNTHSANMSIHMSLGLIKTLTADELVGVMLHEFGHGIDPVIVDINYTEVNILSKYLTDRKKDINNTEKKVLKDKKGIYAIMISMFSFLSVMGTNILDNIFSKFIGVGERAKEKRLNKIKNIIKNDNKFNRQNYNEAFADNFARMYGFAASLMSGLKKLSLDGEMQINSRYKKERKRQEAILKITEMALKDEHRTDIHRIRSLIKEYHDDINDPNTPNIVKKQLEDDVKELEKVLDSYMNDFNEFQNRINKLINEELMNGETNTEDKEELIKEGFQFFDDVFEESKHEHPLKEKMDRECPLGHGDKAKIDKKFGNSKACSWAKDKDGYFCYTHRCRSKSYPTIDDIPQKDVDFVRSTC